MDSQELLDGTDPSNSCSFKLMSQIVTPGSNWLLADCDGDGLSNQEEKERGTDPLKGDSDGDGVLDGKEASDDTNPLESCSFKLTSQTVMPSLAWQSGDCDGDGLTNQQEKDRGTNIFNGDSDGDGVKDGREVEDGTNPLESCSFNLTSQTVTPSANWQAADCDGDGLTNQIEINKGTNPLVADTDGDGINDGEEVTRGTDPKRGDSDGDGVLDNIEIRDGTSPSDGCSFKLSSQTVTPSATWLSADCDNDGLTNERELALKTNPLDSDTGVDFMIDGDEVVRGTDPLNRDTMAICQKTQSHTSRKFLTCGI